MATTAEALYEQALAAHDRGDADGAERAAEAAIGASPEPELAARIQHLRGRILQLDPNPLRAYEFLLTEAASAIDANPSLGGLMLCDAAFSAITGSESAAALRASERGLAIAGIDAGVRAALELAHGLARATGGEPEAGAAEMARAVDVLDSAALETTWAMLHRAASTLFWLEEYERAQTLLEQLVDRARVTGTRVMLPTALDTLAAIDVRLGRWTRADARSKEALRIARELEQSAVAASCLTTLAGIASARGAAAACRHYVDEARTQADAEVFVESWARIALAGLALSERHADEAIRQLEPIASQEPPPDPAIAPWQRELVEAYVRVERDEDARNVLERLAALLEQSQRPSLRALLAHCRGLVAQESFDAEFEEALRWHAQSPTPFLRARTELVYGERLRRAKRHAEAKTHLQLALASFEQLGARKWAARARGELGSDSRTRRRTPLRDVLTPHELQVALVVGRGATNKEAAAQLFVSPKTIDYHLASIYRKLEIRSRTQLALLVARG